MAAMGSAAMASPSGKHRRASFTSPAISGADSAPVHANAMRDQKILSLSCKLGRMVCAVTAVAEPNFIHATVPKPINKNVTPKRLKAPTFVSHFPISKPKTFRIVTMAKQPNEVATKYTGEAEKGLGFALKKKRALPAVKYNNAAK